MACDPLTTLVFSVISAIELFQVLLLVALVHYSTLYMRAVVQLPSELRIPWPCASKIDALLMWSRYGFSQSLSTVCLALQMLVFDLIGLGCLFAVIRMASHNPGELFGASKLKDAVFAQFWQRLGKAICISAFP